MEMLFFPDNPELSAAVKNWWEQNFEFGIALGYPCCCVAAFCNQPPELLVGKATDNDRLRFAMGCYNGQYTGFIPCIDHARQIQAGVITVFDCIQNRNLHFPPFPDFK